MYRAGRLLLHMSLQEIARDPSDIFQQLAAKEVRDGRLLQFIVHVCQFEFPVYH